jgi:hypothetical protein
MSKHHDDFDDLDELISQTRASMIAKLDAATNFNAVLADIYLKADQAEISDPAEFPTVHPGLGEPRTAIDEVCDHIDMLCAVLKASDQSQPTSPLLGTIYLNVARRSLQRLRNGLAKQRTSRDEAMRLIGHVEHNLQQADAILRSQYGLSLDDALHARIGDLVGLSGDIADEVQILRREVARLFEGTAVTAAMTPAPRG